MTSPLTTRSHANFAAEQLFQCIQGWHFMDSYSYLRFLILIQRTVLFTEHYLKPQKPEGLSRWLSVFLQVSHSCCRPSSWTCCASPCSPAQKCLFSPLGHRAAPCWASQPLRVTWLPKAEGIPQYRMGRTLPKAGMLLNPPGFSQGCKKSSLMKERPAHTKPQCTLLLKGSEHFKMEDRQKLLS